MPSKSEARTILAELIATIDVGTNTAHLLVARITESGDVLPVHNETRYVRLGQGVDSSGDVHPAALARLKQTLGTFRDIAEGTGATRIMVVGTSASRDVRNRQALVDFVKNETGLEYRIISGDEEAQLTTAGALSAVTNPIDPCVIVDIGGGSTEITLARHKGEGVTIDHTFTADIGSVRLTERYLQRLPPGDEDVAAARNLIDSSLSQVMFLTERFDRFVGAAGTIRALLLLVAGVTEWSELPTGEQSVSRDQCHAWYQRLKGLDYEQTLRLNERVMTGRADVFLAGVIILDAVFDHLQADTCVVSPFGLRHGLALRYASLKKAGGPGFQETFDGTV